MIQSVLLEAAKKKYPKTADLAALLNVSTVQAWRLLQGKSSLTGKNVDVLAEDLGVKIVVTDPEHYRPVPQSERVRKLATRRTSKSTDE